jgi:nitrous oxidase accessory protein
LITQAFFSPLHAKNPRHAPAGLHKVGWLAPAIFIIALAWLPAISTAADLAVPSDQYPTITAAIAAAHSGDTIRLEPGVYQEHVRIDKTLSLIGSPKGPSIVDGSGQDSVIEITGSGVLVSGLEVRKSGDVIENSDACIYVHTEAADAKVTGNRLYECAFGIWVNGSRKPIISDNIVSGYEKKVFSDRGNGIHIWRIEEGLIKDNRVSRVRDGIYLSNTSTSLIEGNVMDSVRFGIHYMYNDNNSVVGNTTCNSMVGQAIMFSKRLTVNDNVMINNDDHGMLLRTIYDSKIRGNVAYGNNKGIYLNDSGFNEITGNWIQNNLVGIAVMGGDEDTTVLGNNFISNPVQVLYTWRYPLYWDSEQGGNHWSDYLGWDYDGDGIGDKIYYASNRMDHLMHRHPKMRLLALSPVIQLMQALETRFPVLRPASVIDRKPAMRPMIATPSQIISPEKACL